MSSIRLLFLSSNPKCPERLRISVYAKSSSHSLICYSWLEFRVPNVSPPRAKNALYFLDELNLSTHDARRVRPWHSLVSLQQGPSTNQARSMTSESSPLLGMLIGLILTQIVRLAACPSVLKNTCIGSCFVSPFQYGLALYQRWTTLGSSSATKTLGAVLIHWATRAPLSNWLANSI